MTEEPLWLVCEPKEQKEVRLGIIGVGECGTNTIAGLTKMWDPDSYPYLSFCAANTDAPKLRKCFVLEDVDPNVKKWTARPKESKSKHLPPRLWVMQLGDWGTGAGGDPERGKKGAEMQRDALKAFMESVTLVIIVTGLGGGTGTGATPVIVDIAIEMGKMPIVVATLPFAFEGKKKIDLAGAAHVDLLTKVNVITVYNDKLPDKDVDYDVAWRKATEGGLLSPLSFLIRLITVVGKYVNRDLSDLKALLAAGNNLLSVGIEEVDHSKTPEEVVSMLLEGNPFQDAEIVRDAEFIIPAFDGPWTVAESMKISVAIADRARVKGKNLQSNFFVGDIAGRKSVSMLIAAKVHAPAAVRAEVTELVPVAAEVYQRPQLAAVASIAPEPDRSLWEIINLPQGWQGTQTKEVKVPPRLAERWKALRRPTVANGNGNGKSISSESYEAEFGAVQEEILRVTGFAPSHAPAIHSS